MGKLCFTQSKIHISQMLEYLSLQASQSQQVGEVRSVSFSKAFFGLYLGEDPVSKEAKASFEEGLSKLVAHSAEDTKPK